MWVKPRFRHLILSLSTLFLPLVVMGPAMAEQTMNIKGPQPESHAAVNMNFNGTLQLTTCDVRVNRDVLVMEAVGVNDFSGPGSVAARRVPFSLHIENCQLSAATMSTMMLSFEAQASNGKVVPGAFANQALDAHQQPVKNGVGIAVFDQRDDSNVLTYAGESRYLTYPVTASSPFNSERLFYASYMQTAPAGNVSAVLVVKSFYN